MQTSNLHSFDLRIGNLLLYENRVIEVVGLNKGWIEYYNEEFDKCGDKPKYFQPIELTEEMLVKIGFEKEERMSNILYYLEYKINEDEYVRVRYVMCNSKALPLLRITSPSANIYESHELTKRGIKYLHELQNAYYCLTGQELEWEL